MSKPRRTIAVTISVTLSKTMEVEVNDYESFEDASEDGIKTGYDYSQCNLHKAVEEQVVLPQNLANFTEVIFQEDLDLKAAKMPLYLHNAIQDCKYWDVDDFQVIYEE